MRGKKRFLAIFAGIGILGTACLVLVGTGDWLLASIVAIIGRIGFAGANTFYDALLPHVAREEDQDSVSARGYAMGYLGGGLLLAVNVVMIFQLGFETGARLSFLSVAIWWAVFSLPILRQIPEPAAATAKLQPGETVISASFARIWETIKDIRRYGELFKYLIAFLIYNDAIGTIIGVAAIYGAELGFGSTELILALLLVQFVGIPFSLIFGRLPSADNLRRPLFLAFILFNLVALPFVGILGARLLPQNVTGILLPPYETVGDSVGTGTYTPGNAALQLTGNWEEQVISAQQLGADKNATYAASNDPDARLDFPFNGQEVTLTYSIGSEHGIWAVLIDSEPLMEADEDDALVPVAIDAYNATQRYNVQETFSAVEPGEHVLSLVNTGEKNEFSAGIVMSVGGIQVLAPVSQSSLLTIIGAIIVLELVGLLFAFTIGRRIFADLAASLNTKRSIILALAIYSVIAIWGFVINSTIEFWFLAWMVAMVQGGSQALSRSLYTAMSPASKSGEFFGLFGVMEKFSAFIGPLIFALAAAVFGSSRPAILALIAFFVVGGYLLTRVNVEEGHRIAQEEDAAALGNT
jgi:MFS-type transporter involved in bile tolerance (Atg22 family)